MKRKLNWLEDSLKDIKNIISAEGEDCDYESLISDLLNKMEEIKGLLGVVEAQEDAQKLYALQEKAELYLKTLKNIKQKREDSQPGNE